MLIAGNRKVARRVALGSAAVVIAAIAGGCTSSSSSASSTSTGPRATPAPGWTLESVPRDSLLAYGGRLAFDTSHAASDAQNLILPASVRGGRPSVGPYASIAPEIGTASTTRSQLGSGRIIALIDSRGPYAPLLLDSGKTYVWVDSMGAMAGWRMVLISSHARTPLVWRTLANHSGPAVRRSSVAFGMSADYAVSTCAWTQPAEFFAQPCCYCEEWGWCTGGGATWGALR